VRQAPQRTCVGCRRTRAKAQLLRIARTTQGIQLDPYQRLPGRGAYLCRNPDCVEAARHRGGQTVIRALRGGRQDEVQAALTAADIHLREEHNA
jgi:uncharacterized protein